MEGHLRTTLPVHPNQAMDTRPGIIRVDGRVHHPLKLRIADLERLEQQELKDDFACLEGWSVPGLIWQGVPLAAILELAEVDANAYWLQASAGRYSVPLRLDEVRRGILAIRLGENPLPAIHGGPVRLVVPGRECFTSIKWLDHLEVRLTPGTNTARVLAYDRLRRLAAGNEEGQTQAPSKSTG